MITVSNTVGPRNQWNDIFQVLQKEPVQLESTPFEDLSRVFFFSDIKKLKGLITSRLKLQEFFTEVFQTEVE